VIKFRVNLTPINVEEQPSPLGRGCPAAGVFISRSGTGEGWVPANPRELFARDTLRQVLWYASVVSEEK
jgi:hypothetical protein